MGLLEDESPLCKVCNRRATKLVSYTDDGQGQKMCRNCKKKKKRGEQIVRFRE